MLTGNDTLSAATVSDIANGHYTVTGSNSSGCSVTKSAYLGTSNQIGCVGTASNNETASNGIITQVRDHESNSYDVISIGGFCIMKQNLRVTTSPVSGHIVEQHSGSSYNKSYYYHNSTFGDDGYLYSWRAALDTNVDVSNINNVDIPNRRGLCPQGWHLPTKSEWSSIVGNHNAGQFAAPNGSYTGSSWSSFTYNTDFPGNTSDPDKNATGFSAVPVGSRYWSTDYSSSQPSYECYMAFFWSATARNTSNAYEYVMVSDNTNFNCNTKSRNALLSIRCVRDE